MHTHIDTLSTHRCRHTYSSPQKTPAPRQSGLDVYADLAWQQQIDIALHSLFILSVLRPAWFTYSLLHSLAANRLWTSRLSIIEGSLTLLWQACWIDSSDLLFIFACLASSLLGWDQSLTCNSRSNRLLLVNAPNLSLSLRRTTDTDKITGVRVSPSLFSKVICNMTMSYECQQLGEGNVAHTGVPLSSIHAHMIQFTHTGPIHTYFHKKNVPAQTFHHL